MGGSGVISRQELYAAVAVWNSVTGGDKLDRMRAVLEHLGLANDRPDEGRKTYRVAVAVFLETDGIDEHDAGSGGVLAVRQALAGRAMTLPLEVEYVAANGQNTAKVVDVMEVGMAAGNGYLWTKPTVKAFRERG